MKDSGSYKRELMWGSFLKNKAGRIRTFKTHEAASKAAEKEQGIRKRNLFLEFASTEGVFVIRDSEGGGLRLTNEERHAVRVLNHVATFDGVIPDENDIKLLLREGISKFIAKKRQHLVRVTETAYPVQIKIQHGKELDNE